MIEAKTIFYIASLNAIGGVEQWMYYIAKRYGRRKDMIVFFRDGDERQLKRLVKYCDLRIYKGEKIKCDTAIFAYNFDIIGNVEAREKYHFIHGNIEAVRKIYPDMDMLPAPQITKQFSVSEITRQGYKNTYGIDTEVFYNIVDLDKPIKGKTKKKDGILRLITASRLKDAIKGFDYMEIIAKKLQRENIPYEWLCFSDKPKDNINGNFIFLEPELDITPYMKDADYLVQTSRDESYGYSPVESLMLGTPVIMMNIPVLKELGIEDGKHGYILDFDMSNLDINKVYNNIPVVKDYVPPMDFDKWETIFGEDIENGYKYTPEQEKEVLSNTFIATARVVDDVGVKYEGEETILGSHERIRMLLSRGLIKRRYQ